jgi:uncharacterized damage-inducible protein DinB
MHTVYKAFAEYNKNVNAAVIGLLKGLNAEQFGMKLNAYYPTIAATLLHVMSSDAKWLERFSGFRKTDFDTAALTELKGECEKDPAKAFAERERLFGMRRGLDEEIIALLRAMEGADFNRPQTISFGSGMLTRELWKLLLQWFNHQTHHRGQVSLFLDMLGVENDYSKVIDKI